MISFYRDLNDEGATEWAGRTLGQLAHPGLVVALIGPLGAGKTAFTRAMAKGLEVEDLAAVSSPTFTLVQVYKGRLTMHHCDTYRLKHPAEFDDLGVTEWLGTDGVSVIEWADRVAHLLPPDLLVVVLEPTHEGQRRMRVRTTGPTHAAIAAEWSRLVP